MARGDHQLAREDGVSARAVKPRSRVNGGSGELVKFMGVETTLEIKSSASSAIAIAMRRGLERLRHLKVKWPWLQQLVNAGHIRILSVKGIENLSDVGTKFVVKAAGHASKRLGPHSNRKRSCGDSHEPDAHGRSDTHDAHHWRQRLAARSADVLDHLGSTHRVDAAECDSSHLHRQGIHAPINAEATEMTRQASEDTGTHQPRSVHVAHQ